MYPTLVVVLFIVAQTCVSLPLKATQIYTTCPSYSGSITNVELSGCEVAPCNLQRGTTATFIIDFHSNIPVTDLRLNVYAVTMGLTIPAISEQEVCSNLTTPCPIELSQLTKPLQFSYSLDVSKLFPPFKLFLLWEIYEHDVNGYIGCFTVDCQVVNWLSWLDITIVVVVVWNIYTYIVNMSPVININSQMSIFKPEAEWSGDLTGACINPYLKVWIVLIIILRLSDIVQYMSNRVATRIRVRNVSGDETKRVVGPLRSGACREYVWHKSGVPFWSGTLEFPAKNVWSFRTIFQKAKSEFASFCLTSHTLQRENTLFCAFHRAAMVARVSGSWLECRDNCAVVY